MGPVFVKHVSLGMDRWSWQLIIKGDVVLTCHTVYTTQQDSIREAQRMATILKYARQVKEETDDVPNDAA